MKKLQIVGSVIGKKSIDPGPFIEKINQLIEEYNAIPDEDEPSRIRLLEAMKSVASELDSKSSMRLLINSPQYHEQRSALYDAINEQYHQLKIRNPEGLTLGELISNMSSKKLDLLYDKLREGSKGTSPTVALKKIYDDSDHSFEAECFRQYWMCHEPNVLSSGNCLNLLSTSVDGGKKEVLKLDARMNRPKTVEEHLRNEGVDFLAPIHAERYVNGEYNSGIISAVDFYGYGSLFNYRAKEPDDALKKTTQIFQFMAQTFLKMEQENTVFPDAKLDNWLIDQSGKICIADTKSLAFSTNGRVIYGLEGGNKEILDSRYDLIKTPGFTPPEFQADQGGYRADAAHAYLLGKNLYYYLNGANMIVDGKLKFEGAIVDITEKTHTINKELFTGIPGEMYKTLIQSLTKEEPGRRLSLEQAAVRLEAIEHINTIMERDDAELLKGWVKKQYKKLEQSPEAAEEILKELHFAETAPIKEGQAGCFGFRKSPEPDHSALNQISPEAKSIQHHFKDRLKEITQNADLNPGQASQEESVESALPSLKK